MPEKAMWSADIVKWFVYKRFVYIPTYVDCLLASSGSNWVICADCGVLMDWSRGKLRILIRSWCYWCGPIKTQLPY
jgi:hypothetical protein